MPIPPGRTVISNFSGPVGTPVGSGPSVYLRDDRVGFIEAGQFEGMPRHAVDGLALERVDDRNSYVSYDNSLISGGSLVVPTGMGIRFRPDSRRVDVELGVTSANWGVMVNMGLNPAFWDGPDAVFDFDFTEPLYFANGLGAWYEFALMDTGYWCLATGGGSTILEGNIGPAPTGPDDGWFFMNADVSPFATDATEGRLTVDKMWLYGVPALSAVRLHPRDDGRGMSSAPRIHPGPKSGRVIGGYQ